MVEISSGARGMKAGTAMKSCPSNAVEASGLFFGAGTATPAAELVNAIALRANIPAINAAIGAAPAGEAARSIAVVASAMRAVGTTIGDISRMASQIAATIRVPEIKT
jgi:hypothetical protein